MPPRQVVLPGIRRRASRSVVLVCLLLCASVVFTARHITAGLTAAFRPTDDGFINTNRHAATQPNKNAPLSSRISAKHAHRRRQHLTKAVERLSGPNDDPPRAFWEEFPTRSPQPRITETVPNAAPAHTACEVTVVSYCNVLDDAANRAMLRAFAASLQRYKRKFLLVGNNGAMRQSDKEFIEQRGVVIIPIPQGEDSLSPLLSGMVAGVQQQQQHVQGGSNNRDGGGFDGTWGRAEKASSRIRPSVGSKSKASASALVIERYLRQIVGFFGRFDIPRELLRREEFTRRGLDDRATPARGSMCDRYVLYADIDTTFHGPPIQLQEIVTGMGLPLFAAASSEHYGGWVPVLSGYRTAVDANTGVMLLNLLGMESAVPRFARFTARAVADLAQQQQHDPSSTAMVHSTYDQAFFNLFFGGMTRLLMPDWNWRVLYGYNPAARVFHYQGAKCHSVLCTVVASAAEGEEPASRVAVERTLVFPRLGLNVSCREASNALRTIRGSHLSLAQDLCHAKAMCELSMGLELSATRQPIHKSVDQPDAYGGGVLLDTSHCSRVKPYSKPFTFIGLPCGDFESCSVRRPSTTGLANNSFSQRTTNRRPLLPEVLYSSRSGTPREFNSDCKDVTIPWVTIVRLRDDGKELREIMAESIQSAKMAQVRDVFILVDVGSADGVGKDEGLVEWLEEELRQGIPGGKTRVIRVARWRFSRDSSSNNNNNNGALARFEIPEILIEEGLVTPVRSKRWERPFDHHQHGDGLDDGGVDNSLCSDTPLVFFAEPGVQFLLAPTIGRVGGAVPNYFSAAPRCFGSYWSLGLSRCATDISTRSMLMNVFGLASAMHHLDTFLAATARAANGHGESVPHAAEYAVADSADTVANAFFSNTITQLDHGWNFVDSCFEQLCGAKNLSIAIGGSGRSSTGGSGLVVEDSNGTGQHHKGVIARFPYHRCPKTCDAQRATPTMREAMCSAFLAPSSSSSSSLGLSQPYSQYTSEANHYCDSHGARDTPAAGATQKGGRDCRKGGQRSTKNAYKCSNTPLVTHHGK